MLCIFGYGEGGIVENRYAILDEFQLLKVQSIMAGLTNLIQDWAKNFPRRETPTYSQRYQFQIRHCGNEEIRVRDGGEEIWADGVNYETGELIEAKFIENPANSPYVDESNVPPFIRTKVHGDVENEFRRYGAVINDSKTPVVKLLVIVNIREAVPFFEKLLSQFNIFGTVVVMP